MGICGSTVTPPNPDQIDLTHFELLKVVGKGGFGKVNAITKLDTGELMALKRLEKAAVLASQAHLNMVWVERKIMALTTSCPFLCNLNYAFESPTELFLVMPFMQGGDLRYHLKERGTMDEKTGMFYAAEIALGLEHLHKFHIVYRDLKPENVLLDAEGHVRISDFGLSCILDKAHNYQTIGQAGTRGYQAPEVLRDQYYGTEVDVWSYGITVYELLHGNRPFRELHKSLHIMAAESSLSSAVHASPNGNRNEELNRFSNFVISPKLSPDAHSFLKGLLNPERRKRLGCGPRGWAEVREHPFFKQVNWEKLARREVQPPIKPDTTQANCTADADLADQLLDRPPREITPNQQKLFEGWNWNVNLKKKPDAVQVPSSASPVESPSSIKIQTASSPSTPLESKIELHQNQQEQNQTSPIHQQHLPDQESSQHQQQFHQQDLESPQHSLQLPHQPEHSSQNLPSHHHSVSTSGSLPSTTETQLVHTNPPSAASSFFIEQKQQEENSHEHLFDQIPSRPQSSSLRAEEDFKQQHSVEMVQDHQIRPYSASSFDPIDSTLPVASDASEALPNSQAVKYEADSS